MNYRYFRIAFLLLISLLMVYKTSAQLTKSSYRIGLGLSTMKIVGENPGSVHMIPPIEEENGVYGGSFDGAQPGIELRMTQLLGETGDFRIPYGIIYSFYTANERFPGGRSLEQRLRHSLNILSFYTGVHWVFVKFPLANAKAYLGFESFNSFVHDVALIYTRDALLTDNVEKSVIKDKDAAFRLGGLLRIGIEGDIAENYEINTSFGFSLANLLLRDDERGELLTMLKLYDQQESFLYNFNFSLLVQYRL